MISMQRSYRYGSFYLFSSSLCFIVILTAFFLHVAEHSQINSPTGYLRRKWASMLALVVSLTIGTAIIFVCCDSFSFAPLRIWIRATHKGRRR